MGFFLCNLRRSLIFLNLSPNILDNIADITFMETTLSLTSVLYSVLSILLSKAYISICSFKLSNSSISFLMFISNSVKNLESVLLDS